MSKKQTEKVEAPPAEKAKLIVVHAITEDGTHYKPGKEYLGKRAEKFLKAGLLKKG